ncbi:MAG: leucine-rich repeat protein [Tannerellaceae bacterium]|nr:leucine-rich repeat protein [Tannerellaceae bacterium]
MKTKLHLLVSFLLLTVAFASCDKEGGEPEMSYTVTFDADGGAPAPQSQTVKAGEMAVAPAANPAQKGYVFMSWQLSGASTAYNFSTPVNSDITLQARWEEEASVAYWQVTWELNGGTWPADDNHATQAVKGGTLAEPAAPVKAGSTFEGWYKKAALTNKIIFPYDVSPVTGNFTLYAKWTSGGDGGSTDPAGYKIFASLAELKSWLASQSDNTADTPYKAGLKGINLDEGNNWNDLGLAIKGAKYMDLNLQGCTGTVIPDGYIEVKGTPPNVTIITYGTFVNCDNLVAINFPPGLQTIGEYAFRGCDNLASVPLLQGFTSINDRALEYCAKLTSITLPQGLKKIGGDAFQLSGLTSITIPGSVTDFEAGVFMRCESLTTVTIEDGIKAIGADAFWRCSSLSELIMLCTVPPTLEVNTKGLEPLEDTPATLKIKVPVASLNAYQTAAGWKDHANKIVANTN